MPAGRASDGQPTRSAVNLVVTGGAGAIEPAVTWVARSEGLELRAVEFALRDEEDLAHNAQRLIQVVDSLGEAARRRRGLRGAAGPAGHADPRLARGARRARRSRDPPEVPHRRAVATTCSPTSSQLAACIEAALDRELPFKCTAGLHNAVRHRDEETGFEHHGFLNVLLATRTSLDGGGPEEVARVLDETDGAALAVAADGRP